MNKTGYTPVYLRKRKMLLVLPLLVLPFITLGFWALGGGKATQVPKVAVNKEGLNLQLPEAHLKKDNGLDKMSYYEMAAADSDRLKATIRNDPYFTLSNNAIADTDRLTSETKDDQITTDAPGDRIQLPVNFKKQEASDGETKVYDRLKQINEVLKAGTAPANLPKRPFSDDDAPTVYTQQNKLDVNNNATGRLETMMHQLKDGSGSDSEMNQINAMLEKVMDIQHPERLNEKYKQQRDAMKITVLQVTSTDQNNAGFYSDGNEDTTAGLSNSFAAIVCDKQTLVHGAIVKLRLMTDVHVNGKFIPKDNFVYGKASLNGERLLVSVSSILNQNDVFPVALTVYDIDGIEGIYVPGAITRDVAKQSADNALQSVALNSLDPSFGAQAAGAGIETAKTLISKKVKLVKVTVKAGYHVFLKNTDVR